MGDVCCLPLILFFLLFFYFFFFFLLFCGAQTPTSVDTPSAPWTVDTYIDTYGAGTSRPPFLRGHYTSSGQRVFPAVWCFRVLWTDGSVQQLASPSIVRGKRRGGGGGWGSSVAAIVGAILSEHLASCLGRQSDRRCGAASGTEAAGRLPSRPVAWSPLR